MAKKIKFALKMKDGVEVRNLQELRNNFDLNQVTAYFLDGRLETWLSDRYYDELALSIQELNINDPDLQKKLCWILGVTYVEEKTESIEKIKIRSWKLEKLKSITDDEKILSHVDSVAFSQEELADLLDEGIDTIYLCGADFVIPERVKDKTYIGINTKLELTAEKLEKYQKNNIHLINLVKNDSQLSKVNASQSEVDGTNTNICNNPIDIEAVFLCQGDSNIEDVNFLAYVGREKEDYEINDDEAEEYDTDKIDLEFQYKASLKKIENPAVLRYIDAVYCRGKVIYLAEDGQGKVLASLDVISNEIKELRRWNIPVAPYYMGGNCVLASYYDGKNYCTEKISTNGDIKKLPENIREAYLWNFHEVHNGLYSVVNSNDTIEIYDALSEEQYTIPFSIEENEETWKLKIYGKYLDCDTGNLYFFMGTEKKGYFYAFDFQAKEVKLATTIPVQCVKEHFCVKGTKIIYYGSPNNEEAKLMILDTKSGKQKCLWEGIGEKYGFDVGEVKIIGDYLYILDVKGERLYRIKIDGTERTIIYEKNEWLEKNMRIAFTIANRLLSKESENDITFQIKKISTICTEEKTGFF